MYLIFLSVIATWFVVRSNQVQARIPVCRFQELRDLTWTAEAYTAGYFGLAFCGMFFRPWGLIVSAWILGFAFIYRIRSL